METKEAKYVKHHSLDWSCEDVRQSLEWFEELENLTEEQWRILYPLMNDIMEDIINQYEDDIMDFINNKKSEFISDTRGEILSIIEIELDKNGFELYKDE